MKLIELYNALEKAVDSGENTVNSEIEIKTFDAGKIWEKGIKVRCENNKFIIENWK